MSAIVLQVDDLREQYLKEMALVRQTCERTGDGTAAIRRRSAVVDRILIEMWRRAFVDLPAAECGTARPGRLRAQGSLPLLRHRRAFCLCRRKDRGTVAGCGARQLFRGCGILACAPVPARARLRKPADSIPIIWNSPWLLSIGAFWPASFLSTSNFTTSPFPAWC